MYELNASNKRRSILLEAGFIGLDCLVGAAFVQLLVICWQGTLIALLLSAVVAFLSYW